MELVNIVNNVPRVSTNIVAQGFGTEHKNLIELIEKYKNDILDFGKLEEGKEILIIGLKQKIRNKKSKVYYLNENQYIFLGTLTNNTKQAVLFKKKLVKEFSKLKNTLNNLYSLQQTEEYKKERLEGKVIRRTFTDALKDLQKYALEQNPNATIKFVYSRYTDEINKTLFKVDGKYKNIRNYCNLSQIKKISVVEEEVTGIIYKEMESNTPWKEIYYIVKEKLKILENFFEKTRIITIEQLQLT